MQLITIEELNCFSFSYNLGKRLPHKNECLTLWKAYNQFSMHTITKTFQSYDALA